MKCVAIPRKFPPFYVRRACLSMCVPHGSTQTTSISRIRSTSTHVCMCIPKHFVREYIRSTYIHGSHRFIIVLVGRARARRRAPVQRLDERDARRSHHHEPDRAQHHPAAARRPHRAARRRSAPSSAEPRPPEEPPRGRRGHWPSDSAPWAAATAVSPAGAPSPPAAARAWHRGTSSKAVQLMAVFFTTCCYQLWCCGAIGRTPKRRKQSEPWERGKEQGKGKAKGVYLLVGELFGKGKEAQQFISLCRTCGGGRRLSFTTRYGFSRRTHHAFTAMTKKAKACPHAFALAHINQVTNEL